MSQQLPPEVLNLINAALTEDQAFNDPTTQTLIPDGVTGDGFLRAKADGVLAGGEVAREVFHRIDPALEVNLLLDDGSDLTPGTDIASVRGSAASILRAERTALNFMQRMSGIAPRRRTSTCGRWSARRPGSSIRERPRRGTGSWTSTACGWAAGTTIA